ncbi:hypothetical protein V1517DRAFT_180454 [Lipomyces orientalis]|uniref:Uncharacterized protein n=1 Tax=Lipomyces orientalis TaxID=1233043 RepID=A0ACC3TKR0_9ASCO
MPQGGLAAKEQIRYYPNAVRLLPPFTASDWEQLGQIARVLQKFDEFTNLVSTKGLSISLSIGVYYELQDLLDSASTRQGEFSFSWAWGMRAGIGVAADVDVEDAGAGRGQSFHLWLRVPCMDVWLLRVIAE